MPLTRKSFTPARIAALAAVLAAAAIGAKLLFFSAPPAPRFVTATATRGDLEDAVLATGTVQALSR